MRSISAILVFASSTEWIHAKLLFFVFVIIALLQALGAIIGGEVTVVSLPKGYRHRFGNRLKWVIRGSALLLFILTVVLGILNDRSLASADADVSKLVISLQGFRGSL